MSSSRENKNGASLKAAPFLYLEFQHSKLGGIIRPNFQLCFRHEMNNVTKSMPKRVLTSFPQIRSLPRQQSYSASDEYCRNPSSPIHLLVQKDLRRKCVSDERQRSRRGCH